MSFSSDVLRSLTENLYENLRYLACVMPVRLSNELFGDLARVGRPTVFNISGPSRSAWAVRFSHSVWDAVCEAAGCDRALYSDPGLPRQAAEAIRARHDAILQKLGPLKAPNEKQMTVIEADIGSEFYRVNARWREKNRREARTRVGKKTKVLQVHDRVIQTLRKAVALVRLAAPAPASQEATREVRTRRHSQPATAMKSAGPFCSAAELAAEIGKSVDAVDSFLRRYREKYPDCYMQTESRRRTEPKYLYRVSDVLPPLKEHFRRKGKTDGRKQV